MKKLLIFLFLIAAGVAVWYFFLKKEDKPAAPKQQPVAVSRYSSRFDSSIANLLNRYYSLSESLVKWDSAGARTNATAFLDDLATTSFDEVKKDSIIFQTAQTYLASIPQDIQTIQQSPDLTGKRRAYQTLTQNLYDLLRTIKYSHTKVYLHECAMAFNDTETAHWLSNTGSDKERRNPYLGLYHPTYKRGMLTCGETKDSLNSGGK
jgi:hypothetical protein